MRYKNRDIIHISDFSKEEILHLIDTANQIKQNPQPNLLKGKVLGCCFFEPSTRTRLSFESAMHRLGGSVIGFDDAANTSVKKGESLSDSMKMVEHYADAVVIRHNLEGSAQLAADCMGIPVINAGDGANQHPTQTFLDLFTIKEAHGTLDNLAIAIAGDLKHGRTAHSLAEALISFNCRLYLISPETLEMPQSICDHLKENRIKFSFHRSIEEVIHKLDILYMTRLQKERLQGQQEYQMLKVNCFLLKNAKPQLKILHPLPRIHEIDREVDQTPHAYYFEQAKNGVYTRQALLTLILHGELS